MLVHCCHDSGHVQAQSRAMRHSIKHVKFASPALQGSDMLVRGKVNMEGQQSGLVRRVKRMCEEYPSGTHVHEAHARPKLIRPALPEALVLVTGTVRGVSTANVGATYRHASGSCRSRGLRLLRERLA